MSLYIHIYFFNGGDSSEGNCSCQVRKDRIPDICVTVQKQVTLCFQNVWHRLGTEGPAHLTSLIQLQFHGTPVGDCSISIGYRERLCACAVILSPHEGSKMAADTQVWQQTTTFGRFYCLFHFRGSSCESTLLHFLSQFTGFIQLFFFCLTSCRSKMKSPICLICTVYWHRRTPDSPHSPRTRWG